MKTKSILSLLSSLGLAASLCAQSDEMAPTSEGLSLEDTASIIVQQYDADASGDLSLEEFAKAMAAQDGAEWRANFSLKAAGAEGYVEEEQKAHLNSVFSAADTNEDGVLNAEELTSALDSLAQPSSPDAPTEGY